MSLRLSYFLIVFFLIFISSSLFCQPETALEFNGYSSYVDCGNNAVLTPETKITISMWFKCYVSNEYNTLLWRGDVVNNYYGMKITPEGQIRGTLFLDRFYHIYSNTFVKKNQWYHVALTFDASLPYSNMKLYINGNLETQLSTYGTIKWDPLSLSMGAYNWSVDQQNFNGLISNVQIWSRALAQEEIQSKMNQRLNPLEETDLEGYWPFSEGEGNVLHDLSGNNNGYIYNCRWFPDNSVYAKISIDSTYWPDKDYNGFEARTVDASLSTGNITSYTWSLNGHTISNAINPVIEVPSGTNVLVLKVGNGTAISSDSVYIHVYCSQLITEGEINSAPSMLNDSSLFISSFDDRVYKFDSTGTAKWNFLTGGDIRSTAAVLDESNIFVTSEDTRLYSFNNSGIPNWDKAMGGIILSSPAVSLSEKTIYTGLNSGRMFAVSTNGDVLWSYQTDGFIMGSAVIGKDGNIYFGSADKKLYALKKNGILLWKVQLQNEILSSPALAKDGSIVALSRDGFLYKLSSTGQQIWSFNLLENVPNEEHWPFYNSPVIDHEGNVYIGSLNGWFYSISKDGELNWKYYSSGSIYSTASISPDGKVIFYGTVGKELIALNSDGTLKWKLKTDSYVNAPTLVTSNNIVYAGDLSGKVYIIKDIPNSLNAERPVLEWPTFQGNNQRTGEQNNILTSVENREVVPENYSLQNYPNPFNPATTINYSLVSEAKVQIRIFNSLGEVVSSFEPAVKTAGNYQVEWNAGINSSGIYFCTITAVPVNGEQMFNKTIKMVFLK